MRRTLLTGATRYLALLLAAGGCAPRPTLAPPPTPIAAPPPTVERLPADTRLVVPTGHHGTILEIAATPDGAWVATLALDTIVRVFRADTLQEIARIHRPGEHPGKLALSADGSRIAVTYSDDTVMYDVASGQELGRIVSGRHEDCLVFVGDDLLTWRDGLVRWRPGGQITRLSSDERACNAMGLVGPTTLVVHRARSGWTDLRHDAQRHRAGRARRPLHGGG